MPEGGSHCINDAAFANAWQIGSGEAPMTRVAASDRRPSALADIRDSVGFWHRQRLWTIARMLPSESLNQAALAPPAMTAPSELRSPGMSS
jgi:hypothetical protein